MKRKLLFICNSNISRSRTAEDMFIGSTKYETKSAGIFDVAVVHVTQELLDWADVIFISSEKDDKQMTYLRQHYTIEKKEIIDLDIPDVYNRGDSELIRLLKEKLVKYLEK